MATDTQALVFQNLIESVFVRGIADRLTPAGKAELKKAGIDLDRLLPAYPYSVWDQALIAGCTLFPELSQEDALREMGHRTLGIGLSRKFVETLLPIFRALGLHKAIRRALKNQTADNVNRTEYTEVDAHTAELKMSHVGAHPEYSQGVFESLVTMLGGKNVKVEIRERTAPSAVFRITWE